jgi:two-component system sensor histidine kinase AtoS
VAEAGEILVEPFEKISERILSGIVQSIEAAVVLHDRDLKVVFVNEAFKEIYEVTEQDVIGRSPMEFLPDSEESQKKAIYSRLKKTLKTGVKSPYHEFHFCSSSGKYRYLLAISIPIFNQNNEITHVMSLINDITHRKELEQEAVKAAKLATVADLAYTLAHEINNPLTGIKLGLSTLYESLQKAENIQILNSVLKDLNRIQDIVDSFLKARREPSRITREKISKTREIVENVLFHLSKQMNEKNIRVQKEICDSKDEILIDKNGIHQVMLNILLNAIQAVPNEGKIRATTEIWSGGDDSGRYLKISISDNGKGIAPEHQKKIFEPFFSSKIGGTGLGLPICKKIIASHRGGRIDVDSKKGAGTTVNIFLPISERASDSDGVIE